MNERFYYDQNLIKTDESQWSSYTSKRNTVVIAGPGSGKTRILTLKAITLLQSDIQHPSGLACISYSRETVRELKKRLKEYGYKPNKNDFIGTMHGFCLIHILQPFAHIFPEYSIPKQIKIASGELINSIYRNVLSSIGIKVDEITNSQFYNYKTNIERYRSLSAMGLSQVKIQIDAFEEQAAKLYEKLLRQSGYIDFVGMINSATLMIREQDYVKQTLQAKFPWLLIDEYQDLGKSLHEMVLELQAVTEIKVFAVGDMNQSIYGFSGAYPDFLEELNNLDDFNSIQLENNYRSNQGIIEGSLDMLTSSPSRPNYSAKKRVNEDADFTFITCKAEMQAQCEIAAQKIIPKLKAKGISYNEIGILVASSNDVVQMATSLNDYKIPFYIVKWDFVKSDIVNWLQDCAKWCQDAKLQSFDDLFGFWKSQLKRHEHERSTWEVIQQRVHFYETLKTSKEKTSVLEWLNHIFSELDLKKVFEESSYYPEENENLDLLLNEAENKNLKDSPLKRLAFLGKPEDEVTITTRHSSKGLEFEVIIMLGMEEGRFPYTHQVKEDSRQMQEAHRLCYVCVSRAKRECILVMSQKHTIQTRSGPWTIKYEPSRFWVLLMERFGNDKNRFNSGNY